MGTERFSPSRSHAVFGAASSAGDPEMCGVVGASSRLDVNGYYMYIYIYIPGSSKSWKFHVKSGDYQFFEGLSEKTRSFQTPGF